MRTAFVAATVVLLGDASSRRVRHQHVVQGPHQSSPVQRGGRKTLRRSKEHDSLHRDGTVDRSPGLPSAEWSALLDDARPLRVASSADQSVDESVAMVTDARGDTSTEVRAAGASSSEGEQHPQSVYNHPVQLVDEGIELEREDIVGPSGGDRPGAYASTISLHRPALQQIVDASEPADATKEASRAAVTPVGGGAAALEVSWGDEGEDRGREDIRTTTMLEVAGEHGGGEQGRRTTSTRESAGRHGGGLRTAETVSRADAGSTEVLPGLAVDASLYGQALTPCGLADFLKSLPLGKGYFYDPLADDKGLCRSIEADNFNAIRAAKGAGGAVWNEKCKSEV